MFIICGIGECTRIDYPIPIELIQNESTIHELSVFKKKMYWTSSTFQCGNIFL